MKSPNTTDNPLAYELRDSRGAVVQSATIRPSVANSTNWDLFNQYLDATLHEDHPHRWRWVPAEPIALPS